MNANEERARADEHPHDVTAQIAAAYACDRNGLEDVAVRYYDAAWALGVPPSERAGFMLGYGSTLRNVGRVSESIAILERASSEYPNERALQAFIALSHHTAGDHAKALATALDLIILLGATAPDVARYERALTSYRDELIAESGRSSGP